MIYHDFVQGSPEWFAHRREHFNASDAPAMMGCSPYKTRAELLHELHTGIAAEVDERTQRRFDDGHRFEAMARPLAEEIIGEELYPTTGSDGKLSASFDGLTMDGSVAFEHKTLNDDIRERCTDDGIDFAMHHRVQMEQQCMVSGALRVLFMASLWEGETLAEKREGWYESDPDLASKIRAGWEQFAADLAEYTPPEVVEKVSGAAPETLPALRIEVTGMVTSSNMDAFKAHALAVLAGINRELTTDQHFADAKTTVKWCSEVESRLAAAKDHALSQTTSIDELFRTVDDVSAEVRRVRLELDKLVKVREVQIRQEIAEGGRKALDAHVAALNKRLGGNYMPGQHADFAGAIKGKRTIESLRNAVDTTLAHAKIAASEVADAIDANLKAAAELKAGDLLPDLRALVLKSPEDFRTTVKLRIAERDQREQARQEAERERIRAEERAKAEKEAQAAEHARQAELRAQQEAEIRAQREAEQARLAEGRRIENERRAAEQAKLDAERAELARQQAEMEEKRRAEARRAAEERAEAERRERERRSIEARREASIQFAAEPLLAAAKLALVALEHPGNDEAVHDATVALRDAIALAEPATADEAA